MTNERRNTFGILPSLFWESDEGRAIQARGKDAVILSSYLRANRHATMLGYYRLRVDDVLYELPVLETREAILRAFAGLQTLAWLQYDDASGVVWVRDMARQRLNLATGRAIDPEDGRRPVLQRLYDSLPPNPLEDPFYQSYGSVLRLTRRTFAQPMLDAAPEISTGGEGGGGGGRGRGEAPPGGTSTYVPDPLIRSDQDVLQEQERSDKTAAATQPRLPTPLAVTSPKSDHAQQPSGTNFHVIARAARELLAERDLAAKYLEGPIESESDLVEATKRFCAQKKIDYGRSDAVPFDVVHRACASEWLKFHRPDIARGQRGGPR